MAVLVLPKGSMISFINPAVPGTKNRLSEHNRQPVEISVERIEKSHRMANGYMRKYVIADKRTFSLSWNGLPHIASKTVDGKWGGREIENWYNTFAGPFIIEILDGDGTTTQYTVMFTDYSRTVNKRGAYDFWDVSCTLEEV